MTAPRSRDERQRTDGVGARQREKRTELAPPPSHSSLNDERGDTMTQPESLPPLEDRIRDSIARKAKALEAMGQAKPEKPAKKARKKS